MFTQKQIIRSAYSEFAGNKFEVATARLSKNRYCGPRYWRHFNFRAKKRIDDFATQQQKWALVYIGRFGRLERSNQRINQTHVFVWLILGKKNSGRLDAIHYDCLVVTNNTKMVFIEFSMADFLSEWRLSLWNFIKLPGQINQMHFDLSAPCSFHSMVQLCNATIDTQYHTITAMRHIGR